MSVDPALVERAVAIVEEAGGIAMRHFQGSGRQWHKGPGQIVTEADLEIDRFLKDALGTLDTEAGWLSEESLDCHSRLERRRVWIVDPIDGTRSFAQGIPEFTISVGLVEDGRAILALLLNPAKGEFFKAVRGGGARLSGQPIRCSAQTELEGARIVLSQSENRKRRFDRLLPEAQLETIGSLAYKLALVAAGRFDGYLSWRRSHDWDIAAASLILEEAGAILSGPLGEPVRLNAREPVHPGLVAAPPALHEALIAHMREPFRLRA